MLATGRRENIGDMLLTRAASMRGPGRVNPQSRLAYRPGVPGADQREATHPCFILREEIRIRPPGSDARAGAVRRRFPSVRVVLLATAESPCFHPHSGLSGAVWGPSLMGAAISVAN